MGAPVDAQSDSEARVAMNDFGLPGYMPYNRYSRLEREHALTHLPPIKAKRKSGEELFHADGKTLGFDLKEFWSWAASDLISNATRGVLAEFLVAKALALAPDAVRNEWDAYDIETPDGIKIEVKSAALIQSWTQRDYSRIHFSVKPTLGWSSETNLQEKTKRRHANVYVLAFLAHRDQATLDPMNVEQWVFYVLSRQLLDTRTRSQHSITLPTLKKLGLPAHPYAQLARAVRATASL